MEKTTTLGGVATGSMAAVHGGRDIELDRFFYTWTGFTGLAKRYVFMYSMKRTCSRAYP